MEDLTVVVTVKLKLTFGNEASTLCSNPKSKVF